MKRPIERESTPPTQRLIDKETYRLAELGVQAEIALQPLMMPLRGYRGTPVVLEVVRVEQVAGAQQTAGIEQGARSEQMALAQHTAQASRNTLRALARYADSERRPQDKKGNR
jgi:hypothetical protein